MKTISRVVTKKPGYASGARASDVHKGKPVKVSKVVTKTDKVKTVNYGPKTLYGKQSKTKTVIKEGKVRGY